HRPARQSNIFWLVCPLCAERLTTFFAFDPRQHAILLRLRELSLTMRTLKLDRHPHVLRVGREVSNSKAQRIGPELLDHVERINTVAFRLRHSLAVTIEDLRRYVHLMKWDFIDVIQASDYHPRYPERDYVARRHERARGVELL